MRSVLYRLPIGSCEEMFYSISLSQSTKGRWLPQQGFNFRQQTLKSGEMPQL
jgi:hypothetical protein